MASLTVEYYERIKDFLHPHVNTCINDYRKGNIIELPPYQRMYIKNVVSVIK